MSPALLSRDLLLRLDPAALMAAAGFSPDPWQQRVLRSSASRVLLLCCRQVSISSTLGPRLFTIIPPGVTPA